MQSNELEKIAEDSIKDETGNILGIYQPKPYTKPYLDDIFQKYIRFCSLPDIDKAEMLGIEIDEKTGKMKKRPSSQVFAKVFGVSYRTLSYWKKREEFVAQVDQTRKRWGMSRTGNVLAALYRRCIKYGRHEDVELWLAYFDGWDRKKVLELKKDKLEPDDIRTLLALLPEQEQKTWYAKLEELIIAAESIGSSE